MLVVVMGCQDGASDATDTPGDWLNDIGQQHGTTALQATYGTITTSIVSDDLGTIDVPFQQVEFDLTLVADTVSSASGDVPNADGYCAVVRVSTTGGQVQFQRSYSLLSGVTSMPFAQTITWDGQLDDGSLAEAGTYLVQAGFRHPDYINFGGYSYPTCYDEMFLAGGHSLSLTLGVPAAASTAASFSTFDGSTSFLYDGADPIQIGVDPIDIEPERVGVVRGKVMDRDGEPLPGVTVRIKDHSEYGHTVSRYDGMFDLAVNSGSGELVIVFTDEDANDGKDYLTVHRSVVPAAGDFVLADDVVMIERAPAKEFLTAQSVAQLDTYEDEEDGEQRTTALLMRPQTSVVAVTPTGNVDLSATKSSLDIRISEYTLGDEGLAAMPAALPTTTAYTFAAEASIDEADAEGAITVMFDPAVVVYVEDFLNVPAGGIVPLGTYDRVEARWNAEDNGIAIEIVSIDDPDGPGPLPEEACIDAEYDGQTLCSSPTMLEQEFGITLEERQRLAEQFPAGTVLWRSELSHFTPFDCNFPQLPPGNSAPPPLPGPATGSGGGPGGVGGPPPICGDNSSVSGSSEIEVEDRVLKEHIPLNDLGITLSYRSDRVEGHTGKFDISVPLDEAAATGAAQLTVEMHVAGRHFQHVYEPVDPANGVFDLPDQHEFTWDGRDAYGRLVQSSQPVTVRVGHVYQMVYVVPLEAAIRVFGAGVNQVGNYATLPARETETLFSEWRGSIGLNSNPTQLVGGWSLSSHHRFDAQTGTLHYGDGRTRRVASGESLTAVPLVNRDNLEGVSVSGDAIAVDDDETVFFCGSASFGSPYSSGCFARSADGTVSPFELPENNHWSDNRFAMADDGSMFVAVGSLFVGEPLEIYHTPQSDPVSYAHVATIPSVNRPNGVMVVADDGAVFVVNDWKVYRVAPSGLVEEFVSFPSGFGAQSSNFFGIAMGSDGSLYLADSYACIWRVDPFGQVVKFAGQCDGSYGSAAGDFAAEGTPAKQATLGTVKGVDVAKDGTVYFTEIITTSGQPTKHRVASIDRSGLIWTVAGGEPPYENGEIPALDAPAAVGGAIAIGPSGRIYFPQYGEGGGSPWRGITMLTSPRIEATQGELLVPDPSEELVYIFDAAGVHQRTLHGLTGAVLQDFDYDASGRLVAIHDAFGRTTHVERTNGVVTGIRGPHDVGGSQLAQVSFDAEGYLQNVVTPDQRTWGVTYHDGGLLESFTPPNNATSWYTYDPVGRLTSALSPDGFERQFGDVKTLGARDVTTTSALGRVSTYGVEAADGVLTRTWQHADGTSSELTIDGYTASSVSSDGTQGSLTYGADSRFGMARPRITEMTTTSPLNTSTVSVTRSATVASLFDFVETTTLDMNGDHAQLVRTSDPSGTSRLVEVTTSPEGRVSTMELDEFGRTIRIAPPAAGAAVAGGNFDLFDTQFGYDPTSGAGSSGRLIDVVHGGRTTGYTYTDDGRIETITSAAGETTTFHYDSAGHLEIQELHDGRMIEFSYDAMGNITGVTPPSRPRHDFSFTSANLLGNYGSPTGATTQYVYNLDRQLTNISRPDGAVISYNYDPVLGRLDDVSWMPGNQDIVYAYDTQGRAEVLQRDSGVTLELAYDGPRLVSESWSWGGGIGKSVAMPLDAYGRVQATTLDGATYGRQYDGDGLLTHAGDMVLEYDPSGLLARSYIGDPQSPVFEELFTYTRYAEVETHQALLEGALIFEEINTYDAVGRIEEASVYSDGDGWQWNYQYDDTGRLIEVVRDGETAYLYQYDENSNRVRMEDHLVGQGYEAEVDPDEDRIVAYAEAQYAYDANGTLELIEGPSGTKTFDYDVWGSLEHIELPSGETVTYRDDAKHRRVERVSSSSGTTLWTYQGQLDPVAEYDDSGYPMKHFVYAARDHVPSYMVLDPAAQPERFAIVGDVRGSVRLVVNIDNPDIAQRLDYSPFGQVLTDTNPGFQPFGFAGGLYDHETALVRFGARDYDAFSGRWTAKDPIRFAGGDSNLYGYVLQDPVNWTDSSGLAPMRCTEPGNDDRPWFCSRYARLDPTKRQMVWICAPLAGNPSDKFVDFQKPGKTPSWLECNDTSLPDAYPDNIRQCYDRCINERMETVAQADVVCSDPNEMESTCKRECMMEDWHERLHQPWP